MQKFNKIGKDTAIGIYGYKAIGVKMAKGRWDKESNFCKNKQFDGINPPRRAGSIKYETAPPNDWRTRND